MQTYLQLILWCIFTYYNQNKFDFWYGGSITDGTCFGIKKLPDGSTVIALEGSHDLQDWWHNFDILPETDSELGIVNKGMMVGIRMALALIIPYLDKSKKVYVTGHSRGASQALYIGALLILRGYDVVTGAFEPARTMHNSDTKLADIYKGKQILITRNGDDPVTEEPSNYLHPAEVTAIMCAPVNLDPELEMKWHHVQVCSAAMAILSEMG